jgi:hypothetical protein
MGSTAGRIFLSYRREDTRHMAGRLADRLDLRFGSGTAFMDVDAIEPGADFTNAIAEAVSSCDLLIALIGPNWLALSQGTRAPRIYEYDDFVAIEIKAALDRGICVIPILVDQAKMPTSLELPASLRPLATRNATRIDHETFSSDVERFLAAVERIPHSVAMERTARQPQIRPAVQPPRGPDPSNGRSAPTHASSDQPHRQPEPRQSAVKPAHGVIGTPASDTLSTESPTSIPHPRIPTGRAALRVALWWTVYVVSIFGAFVISSTAWPNQTTTGALIVFVVLVLPILTGISALLRREVRIQRQILRQLGPDGEALLPKSAVSVTNVRKVAVICAVVAVGFGSLVAVTPPATTAGSGTSTAP